MSLHPSVWRRKLTRPLSPVRISSQPRHASTSLWVPPLPLFLGTLIDQGRAYMFEASVHGRTARVNNAHLLMGEMSRPAPPPPLRSPSFSYTPLPPMDPPPAPLRRTPARPLSSAQTRIQPAFLKRGAAHEVVPAGMPAPDTFEWLQVGSRAFYLVVYDRSDGADPCPAFSC